MSLPCSPDTELQAAQAPALLAYPVTDRLTLAGQPRPADWARLAAEGFAVVINMRSDPERAAVQQRSAEAAGLRYLHLPLPAYELEPEHLAVFHDVLHGQAGRVFLHCRSATRVALLWMLDEIVYGGRAQEAVEADLRAAGYGDDSMDTFSFCAEDYFERAAA